MQVKSFRSRLLQSLTLLVVGVLCSLTVNAQRMTGSGEVIDRTYRGGSIDREYYIYVPRSYDGSVAVPMIFALHGCIMDHNDTLNLWNFDLIADQHNVIIVYPWVTRYNEQRSENCWGFWFDEHVKEGRGGEVDDLVGMALEVEADYNIDSNRRYMTGLSSGGDMSVASGIAYNEFWAAIAPAESGAYGDGTSSSMNDRFESLQFHVNKIENEIDSDRPIPTLVIHSTNDTVKMIRGGELIRDSHLTVFADDLNADGTEDCSREGINCTLTTYNGSDGNPLVQTLFYDGVASQRVQLGEGHYWTGDDQNTNKYAEEVGPSASEQAWAFFQRYTLDGYGGGACQNENDTTPPARPNDLTLVEVRDRFATLSVTPNTEEDFARYNIYYSNGVSAGSSASTPITVTSLNPESDYSVYVRAVDGCGNESQNSNTINFRTTALEYVAPSATGTVNDHYIANRIDTNQYQTYGTQYGYMTAFTLWQLQNGTWTDVNPNEITPTPVVTPPPVTPTPVVTPEITPTPVVTPEITPTPVITPEITPTPVVTPPPGTPTPTPAPNCEQINTQNYAHRRAGRAYGEGSFFSMSYFAQGSNDPMPGNAMASNTLHSFDGSYWRMGECN